MITISYFVHGTSTDNENDIASGWKDCDLSSLGIKQCEELSEYLKNTKFDLIFCSDLKRAINSANIVFKNQKIIQDDRIRECNYGDLNGAPSNIIEDKMIWAINNPFPNGESYLDVEKRINDFLSDMKNNHQNCHIAIMAHRAPQLALDVILNGKTWEKAMLEDWRHSKNWQPGWNYLT